MFKRLRRVFWKVAPPPEVVATRQRIRDVLASSEDLLIPAELQAVALELTRDIEKTLTSLRIDRRDPDDLALLLIGHALARLLGSGKHHLHRGVLSASGRAMLRMWERVTEERRARGDFSDPEAEQELSWMRQQILDVG